MPQQKSTRSTTRRWACTASPSQTNPTASQADRQAHEPWHQPTKQGLTAAHMLACASLLRPPLVLVTEPQPIPSLLLPSTHSTTTHTSSSMCGFFPPPISLARREGRPHPTQPTHHLPHPLQNPNPLLIQGGVSGMGVVVHTATPPLCCHHSRFSTLLGPFRRRGGRRSPPPQLLMMGLPLSSTLRTQMMSRPLVRSSTSGSSSPCTA